MTSTPDAPDGADLAALREEIDQLKAIPEEELVNPTPAKLLEREPEAEPTDAIGSEKWDVPADEESLDQQ
jgi:hypothetical protein